jgi:protein-arginine kinase activator protein McsA
MAEKKSVGDNIKNIEEETLEELKVKLQQAILAEDFETAAFLRDKIRILEKKEK